MWEGGRGERYRIFHPFVICCHVLGFIWDEED
jgi:hypothetical protein